MKGARPKAEDYEGCAQDHQELSDARVFNGRKVWFGWSLHWWRRLWDVWRGVKESCGIALPADVGEEGEGLV
jgi:hypothetical protein